MGSQEVAYEKIQRLTEYAESCAAESAQEIETTLRRMAREVAAQQQALAEGWLDNVSAESLRSSALHLDRLCGELRAALRRAAELRSLVD